jgi:hypothetical protein
VYSLLGLVTEGMEMGIKANYTLSTIDTYIHIATSIVRESKYLDILSVSQPIYHNNMLLPS